MQRDDLIGGICAILALCLIAWLAMDAFAIANCRDVLAEAPSADASPEAVACGQKLERHGGT